jgi:DNA-directed RNA polymerase II subunit RPB3
LNEFHEDEKKLLVASCPKGVFEYDETSQTVFISRAADCIFCRECIYTLEEIRKRPEDPLAVSVKHSQDKFIFTVETTGSLKAKEVVRMALQELSAKINRLKAGIRELNI